MTPDPVPAGLAGLALGLLGQLLPPDPSDARPEFRLLIQARRKLDPHRPLDSLAAHAREEDWRLLGLQGELGLSSGELLAAVLAAAVETDPLVGQAVAALQAPLAGSRPTLGLLARLPGCGLARLAGGAAVSVGLLELLDPDRPLAERGLRLAEAVALALAGMLPVGCQVLPGGPLPPSLAQRAARLAHWLGREPRRCVLLRGGDAADREALAAAVAAALERRGLRVSGDPSPGLGVACRLGDWLPVQVLELAPGERRRAAPLPGYEGPRLVLAGPDGQLDAGELALLELELPLPPWDERLTLWRRVLGASVPDSLADPLLGPARIAAVGRRAALGAELEGVAWDPEQVRAAALAEARGGLEALALPLPEAVPDSALVAPPDLRADLDLLLARCRRREGLSAGLGQTLALRYGSGMRALLCGASGTGKSLAAGWLATRLGMPLFRVDLAAVVSKYIGETEKNLAELLARAEAADVVLLFDEADSLFGKRTEVKDSTDRYANNQTNYLLSRIEAYRGIVVLTSNSRQRLDPAFTRRLDLVIEVPLPGPRERRDLWLAHLGPDHALQDRELNRLAAGAELAGGAIRNAVLTAAVLAREAGRQGCPGMAELCRGLAVEYRKLGKALPAELNP